MTTTNRPRIHWREETPTVNCYRTNHGELVSVDKFEKIETAFTGLVMAYGEDFTPAENRKIQKAIALISSLRYDVDKDFGPY
jgi:hypothetical protein